MVRVKFVLFISEVLGKITEKKKIKKMKSVITERGNVLLEVAKTHRTNRIVRKTYLFYYQAQNHNDQRNVFVTERESYRSAACA